MVNVCVKWECPYCGMVNEQGVREAGMQIVWCDVEDAPGCGEATAINVPAFVTIKPEVFKLVKSDRKN